MVFSKPNEAREFVDVVADVKHLHGFQVLAWCLMGNHYHIVIRTQSYTLWRSMTRIQSRVARGHNRRRKVLGRLWQSRYKARVVLDDIYYRQLLAYVHLPKHPGSVSRWLKTPRRIDGHDTPVSAILETVAELCCDMDMNKM